MGTHLPLIYCFCSSLVVC
uniref:Uncharacterized protein n=1 Tax=Arundo donax TaxID=35708 RepID=A0A0A9A3M6_ARUDO